ncbi:hypothetical protein RIF29_28615 [Crotalaria pallida]|uniref:Reverse transcriptase zinc-binding domain-containing protein n=1 Tax=Crotalaria pallida TaxID=3830 RepID=A0AAN9EI90_CROPI
MWKGLGPLDAYAICEIPVEFRSAPAAFYAVNGSWNWSILHDFLEPSTCAALAGISAPQTNGEPDKPIWSLATDGLFSITSAYKLLDGPYLDDDMIPTIPNLIWNWNGPERMKLFTWKLLHGWLLTNEERCHRATLGWSNMLNGATLPKVSKN